MRRGYDLSFHNFVGKQSKRPAGVAGRRLRAGQGNQLGLTLAIEDRLNRRRLAFLACKYRIQPFVDEFRTYPRYHRNVGIERLAYFFIRPACPTTDKALQASWYFVKDYPLGSSLGVYGEFTCTPGISGKNEVGLGRYLRGVGFKALQRTQKIL